MISHKTDIIHLGEYSVENIAYKLISSSQSNIINNRNIPKRGQILSSYLLYPLPPFLPTTSSLLFLLLPLCIDLQQRHNSPKFQTVSRTK